jgi:hypothetical protein
MLYLSYSLITKNTTGKFLNLMPEINLIEITNKMHPCSIIYYSNVS